MSKAKKNDKVKVHYTGTLSNGQVFDSSVDREPLEFVVGAGQMIKGFDKAVDGMELNEIKTFTIPADEGYGQRSEDLVQEVSKNQLPSDLNPEVGQMLVATTQDGRQTQVQITGVNNETVTIDANHPLAGKDLTFEVELVEIT